MRCAFTALVVATLMTGAARAQTATVRDREGLLDRAPHPANRVVDPLSRPEIGRLWDGRAPVGSRTPIPEQTRSEPGPAFYGAAADAPPRVIFARVGTNAIAVEPWTRIEGRGDLHTLERARGRWLHEQGYTGGVRTHVNTHARREGRRGEAPPRAVIDVSESVEPERVARFSMPPGAAPRGPVRVLAADEGIDPAPSATLAVRE